MPRCAYSSADITTETTNTTAASAAAANVRRRKRRGWRTYKYRQVVGVQGGKGSVDACECEHYDQHHHHHHHRYRLRHVVVVVCMGRCRRDAECQSRGGRRAEGGHQIIMWREGVSPLDTLLSTEHDDGQEMKI